MLFFGILRDIVGRSEESLEIDPNSTPATLFETYSRRFETLRNKRASIVFARNREFTKPDAQLQENDEVAFLPPVSGGSDSRLETATSGSSGHVFAITRNPIHSHELSSTLQRPQDGALIVFEGIVRNNTNGRQTDYLEYECYEQMALEQIARIGNEIAASFPIGHIGIIHRLGRLQIGEVSVAIVVTAPHRKAAFAAALEGINRVKREVPIWKKEFYTDGEAWVDGEWDERLIANSSGHEAY